MVDDRSRNPDSSSIGHRLVGALGLPAPVRLERWQAGRLRPVEGALLIGGGPLAERVVERVVDGLHRHTKTAGFFAIDRELELVAQIGEIVADIGELAPRAEGVGKRGYDIYVDCFARGLLCRVTGDTLALAPPLIIEKPEIDRIVETVGKAIAAAA